MLTNAQFEAARQLALRLAGIELFARHRAVLARRIHRFGIHDAAGFDALIRAADLGDAAATRQMVGLLTTNFTGFFRHPQHFKLAAEHALQAVRRRGAARLWSAAAATGEEPYSLAMAVLEVFQRPDPPVTILATDISESSLAVARLGEYGEAALGTINPEQRGRFFSQSGGAARWQPAPEIQRLVEFRALNLIDPAWAIEGPFDVIFSRNVLMYLEARYRQMVLERLASVLAPDGLLMLDPAEHLGRAAPLFARGHGGVYPGRAQPRNQCDQAWVVGNRS